MYILFFMMALSKPCHAAPKRKNKKKNPKYKNSKKRRKLPKKEEVKKDETENTDIELNNESDQEKKEEKKKEQPKKSKENKNEKLKEEVNKDESNEKDEKEDPKELYSYTWKSEKKKIFEKKEREVHGNKTTKYATFGEIKDNINIPYKNVQDLDVRYIHHWTLNEKYGNTLQDLGVDGTPSRYMYFDTPYSIGTTSGFSHYDLYFKNPTEIRIYDTKSPYTYIFIIPGRKISKLVFEYSQNINENWNVGGTFSNLSMASPFELYPKHHKYALSRMWDIHTHYNGFNNKHDLIITLSGMKHYSREFGVFNSKAKFFEFSENDKIEPFADVYFPNLNLEYPKNYKPKFLDVNSNKSNGKNKNSKYYLNIYNQYEIFDEKKVYYQLGFLYDNHNLGEREGDELEDDHPKQAPFRSTTMKGIDNEIGFKGIFSENILYRVYVKRSDLWGKHDHLDLNEKPNKHVHIGDNYFGVKGKYQFTETSSLSGLLEYLLLEYYKTGIMYQDESLELFLKLSRKKNSFIYDSYKVYNMEGQGISSKNLNEIIKKNDKNKSEFSFPFINKAGASYKIYKSDYIMVKPNLMALSIGQELAKCEVFACPGGELNFTLGNIHIDNNMIGSFRITDFKIYELPTFFINSSIYYLTSFYKNKLKLSTGFDIYFKTKYKACLYSGFNSENPIYTFQEDQYRKEVEVGGYPVVNLFLNLMYENLCLFFKITHLNDGWISPGGYYATNQYPGQRRSFDLGIAWKFFN